jgi:hypothetical protein
MLPFRMNPMILRAIPLAVLLFWLAYQSHFSPSFFAQTVSTSLSLIAAGTDDALAGDVSSDAQKVAARTE